MDETVLVLGASARAAAHSASRAGFSPIAADLFADKDLTDCCPAIQVDDYPAGLESAARRMPPCPWLYTGALENHPQLVDRISQTRTLYGNPGHVLLQARHPANLAAALKQDGLPSLDVCLAEAALDGGQWLCKPWESCGGAGIHMYGQRRFPASGPRERQSADGPTGNRKGLAPDPGPRRRRRWFFQRLVRGAPRSAVYVAAAGSASLIGVTRQLIGTMWTGAKAYRYAGSLGPLRLSSRDREWFARIGNCVARRFDLQGLFGVDAIQNEEGIWPVEVNPRYTASVEILERGLGVSAIAEHVAACREGQLFELQPETGGRYWGKAIVYARTPVTVSAEWDRLAEFRGDGRSWPPIADMPQEGTHIESGRPVITVFAVGSTLGSVYGRLRRRVRRLQALLRC